MLAQSIRIVVLCVLMSWGPMLAAPANAATFAKTRLAIETQTGQRYPFTVEVADTPEQREQGLMFRDHLPDDGGMLFVFPTPHVASFWMRNTFISLDIIFVARDGRIVSIHERAVPGSNAVISSTSPVGAVLELKGGTTARLGIRPGDRLIHATFQ